jgi:hypothetical protein
MCVFICSLFPHAVILKTEAACRKEKNKLWNWDKIYIVDKISKLKMYGQFLVNMLYSKLTTTSRPEKMNQWIGVIVRWW